MSSSSDFEPIDLAAIREGRIDVIGEVPDWKRPLSECQHSYHVVDPKLRRVTCRDCGETLDPIEVIIGYVHFWRRQAEALKRLTDLKAEERQRETDRQEKASARRVAREGIVWACDLASHYEYEESKEYAALRQRAE